MPAVANDSQFPQPRFFSSEHRAALVGRAAEMRELERAYGIARDNWEARTVTVLGATGIGKTRLVRDFLIGVGEGSRQAPRVYRGATREGGPAYDVFARILRGRFGIVEGMDAETARGQVRAQLAAVLEDRKVGDVAYFLGQLLELDFQDSPLIRAVEGDPEQMRSMRRAVIKSFLETDAGKASDPLVLVFDDLQWAHDDSLELLEYLVENLHGPILFLCLTRPEMLARRDAWRRYGNGRHVAVEIGPLGDDDAAAVVRDLLAPCGVADAIEELVDTAVNLAGGNPALLGQIVRIYHEAGVLVVTDDFDDERWIIAREKLTSVKLPLTVQDVVQARIAALVPEERELLERAAAMGGVFWLGGLVAISRQNESPPEVWEGGEADDVVLLRHRLSELVDRDYVLRLPDSTFAGDEEYVFKHNLEREAVERLTPPAASRRYHRAVAEWLSFRASTDVSEEYLEMLGRHREKAGAVALAASSFIRAGEVARSRGANAKAAELLAKGLQLLEQSDYADEDLRLTTLNLYGDVLQALGRSQPAYAVYVDTRARAWRLDLRNRGGAAHLRIGRLHRDRGRLEEASRHLTAALALFGQARDDRGTASALDDIGRLHWLKGDFALAIEYTLRSLAMRRKTSDRPNMAVSLNNLGSIQHEAANYKAATVAFEQALRIRRDLGDVVGVSMTLGRLGLVARDTHDDSRALALFREAYEIGKESADRNRMALIVANLGATHHRLRDETRGLSALKQAEAMVDELGDRLALARALRGLGKAYLERGEHGKARELVSRAAKIFSEAESRVELGAALRFLGEALASGSDGNPQAAAEKFKRSVEIFEQVGNDVELAQTCRAYAEVLRRTAEYGADPAVTAEAARLVSRAEAIRSKTRRLSSDDEVTEVTEQTFAV
jgi:tetratricopeptide (TPR) repeat protein